MKFKLSRKIMKKAIGLKKSLFVKVANFVKEKKIKALGFFGGLALATATMSGTAYAASPEEIEEVPEPEITYVVEPEEEALEVSSESMEEEVLETSSESIEEVASEDIEVPEVEMPGVEAPSITEEVVNDEVQDLGAEAEELNAEDAIDANVELAPETVNENINQPMPEASNEVDSTIADVQEDVQNSVSAEVETQTEQKADEKVEEVPSISEDSTMDNENEIVEDKNLTADDMEEEKANQNEATPSGELQIVDGETHKNPGRVEAPQTQVDKNGFVVFYGEDGKSVIWTPDMLSADQYNMLVDNLNKSGLLESGIDIANSRLLRINEADFVDGKAYLDFSEYGMGIIEVQKDENGNYIFITEDGKNITVAKGYLTHTKDNDMNPDELADDEVYKARPEEPEPEPEPTPEPEPEPEPEPTPEPEPEPEPTP